jgi:hypothetical protein
MVTLIIVMLAAPNALSFPAPKLLVILVLVFTGGMVLPLKRSRQRFAFWMTLAAFALCLALLLLTGFSLPFSTAFLFLINTVLVALVWHLRNKGRE